MTPDEWGGVALRIHEVYGRTLSQAWAEVGGPLLCGYDADVVIEAVRLHMLSERSAFMPNPGELAQIASQIAGDGLPTFAEVYGEIMRAVRRHGHPTPVSELGLSPVAEGVVRAYGWREWCACEEPDVQRGQARRLFDDVVRRLPAEQSRAMLAGAADRPLLDP